MAEESHSPAAEMPYIAHSVRMPAKQDAARAAMDHLEIAAKPLLTLSLVVEPDRQRLARFVIDAVDMLGGDVFPASTRVVSMLETLRRDGRAASATIHG